MLMAVMCVREMRVKVRQWFVLVPMVVLCARRNRKIVFMLVMFIVNVLMLVLHHFVSV